MDSDLWTMPVTADFKLLVANILDECHDTSTFVARTVLLHHHDVISNIWCWGKFVL